MLLTCWLPLALLALHQYVADGRRRWLVIGAASWMMAGLTTGYYLVYLAVLIGCWVVWHARTRRQWLSIAVAFGSAALLMLPLLIAYKTKQSALGLERPRFEIELFSADLSSIWAASRRGDMLAAYWTAEPGPEGELYPGAAIAIVAIVGAVAGWRRLPKPSPTRLRRMLAIAGGVGALAAAVLWVTGGWSIDLLGVTLSATRPHRPFTIAVWLLAAAALMDPRLADAWRRRSRLLFYLLATAAMFVLALGPVPRFLGETFMQDAPYAWLMALPGGSALRVPARFGVLFMLCLSQAAAIGLARLTPRGAPKALIGVLAALILADGYMLKFPVEPVVPALAADAVPAGNLVLELPVDHHAADPKAMVRSIGHRHPLINGYSGYQPPHYSLISSGLTEQIDPSLMQALQTFGPITVLVSRSEGVFSRYRELMDAYPEATPIGEVPAGMLYSLPHRPAPARDPLAKPVKIAALDASTRASNTSLVLDGDLETRWETEGRQRPGQWLKIALATPATISRVELDLGKWNGDYPRGLRIDAVPADSDVPVTVWDDGTTGATMLATLADRGRVPVTLDLSAPIRARELLLTVTAGHADLAWSIAELRVLGR
jgi:hypothetical protein